MPRYAATFTISCMTRQAFEALGAHLSQSTEVTEVRLAASFTGGVMLMECTAADRPALDAWMQRERLQPGAVYRLDVEVADGQPRLL